MATATSEQVKRILDGVVNPIVARGVFRFALHQCGLTQEELDLRRMTQDFAAELERGLKVMSNQNEQAEKQLRSALLALLNSQTSIVRSRPQVGATRQRGPEKGKKCSIPGRRSQGETIWIHQEVDIVRARRQARELAQRVGFGSTDQTKIATAVSEVSRNIFIYAHEGTVTLLPLVDKRGLRIEARDKGPGIADLDRILSGEYTSKTGMGLGLRGCRRLMDRFEVDSTHGGTVVIMEKEVT